MGWILFLSEDRVSRKVRVSESQVSMRVSESRVSIRVGFQGEWKLISRWWYFFNVSDWELILQLKVDSPTKVCKNDFHRGLISNETRFLVRMKINFPMKVNSSIES